MGTNSHKSARVGILSFMLISALALLVIGIPRFLHELVLVPGTPILHRMNTSQDITEDEWAILEQSRLNALDFIDLPDAHTDLGSAYLWRAQKASDLDEQAKYAQMSIDALTKGLERSSFNAYAWSKLAVANLILGEDHFDDALKAWRMSMTTSPNDHFLTIARMHIGITLYGKMSPEDIGRLKKQLTVAFPWYRGRLRTYARQNDLMQWMVLLSVPNQEMVDFFSK